MRALSPGFLPQILLGTPIPPCAAGRHSTHRRHTDGDYSSQHAMPTIPRVAVAALLRGKCSPAGAALWFEERRWFSLAGETADWQGLTDGPTNRKADLHALGFGLGSSGARGRACQWRDYSDTVGRAALEKRVAAQPDFPSPHAGARAARAAAGAERAAGGGRD